MTISGWFEVPSAVGNKGDAFHSFNKRGTDKFGARMTQGQAVPDEWKNSISVASGGINGALAKYKSKTGKKAEVKLLEFTLLDFGKWRAEWVAHIGESTGEHHTHVGTCGGIGIGGGKDVKTADPAQHPGISSKIAVDNIKKGKWKPVPIKVKNVKLANCRQYEKAQGGAIEIVNTKDQLQLRQFFYQSNEPIY